MFKRVLLADPFRGLSYLAVTGLLLALYLSPADEKMPDSEPGLGNKQTTCRS